MRLFHKRLTQGFTLIELVIVIIVLGVLAASAIPKFVNRSGFEDYTLQDKLIARLRLVQLQNMNADPNPSVSEKACYWLVVKDDCFYHEFATCNTAPVTNYCSSDSFSAYSPIKYTSNMLAQQSYLFNHDGKLLAGSSPITIDKTISINGDNNLKVKVNTEGYINAVK